jgi:hypothetical protein
MARPEIETKISFFIELFSTKHDKESYGTDGHRKLAEICFIGWPS